jgi:hypothetical protein
LPISEGFNQFENPFRQTPLPSQDSQNSPGLTTVQPPSNFGDRSEIIFQENIPIFHENQLNNHHHQSRLKDFSTPIPFTRKPYPKEVKQLTQLPGIPIPLKQHGPFKVLQRPTFHSPTFREPTFHSTTFPTTTLSPSFVSTLPPRINVTPAPISETVISTTFSANRFEASPYGPSQVNKAIMNLLCFFFGGGGWGLGVGGIYLNGLLHKQNRLKLLTLTK